MVLPVFQREKLQQIIIAAVPGNKATVGTLVTFTAFVGQFYGPIMELANSNRMVTRAATSAQRVFEVLDTGPEIYSTTGAVTSRSASTLPPFTLG